MTSPVQFGLTDPHTMPVVQHATAFANGNLVVVAFRMLVTPERLETVYAEMLYPQAVELQSYLAKAIGQVRT